MEWSVGSIKVVEYHYTKLSSESFCNPLRRLRRISRIQCVSSCWNDRENLDLSHNSISVMDLSGQILNSLQFYSSLQNLDLSRNSISGAVLPISVTGYLRSSIQVKARMRVRGFELYASVFSF
ncbi:hypothetical protein Scep_018962 [Stephania cephalantha]|uniref:Uncharacterized protein n=1 Tax=Stephania cephalantha TaxID=152367 RepID=A0AAP0NLP8_9MAGN